MRKAMQCIVGTYLLFSFYRQQRFLFSELFGFWLLFLSWPLRVALKKIRSLARLAANDFSAEQRDLRDIFKTDGIAQRTKAPGSRENRTFAWCMVAWCIMFNAWWWPTSLYSILYVITNLGLYSQHSEMPLKTTWGIWWLSFHQTSLHIVHYT